MSKRSELAGARPNPRWLAALLGQGHSVYCGFDADPTGETMARAMMGLYPSVQRLCPPQHDWNDVLKVRAYLSPPGLQQLDSSEKLKPATWKEEASLDAMNQCLDLFQRRWLVLG